MLSDERFLPFLNPSGGGTLEPFACGTAEGPAVRSHGVVSAWAASWGLAGSSRSALQCLHTGSCACWRDQPARP